MVSPETDYILQPLSVEREEATFKFDGEQLNLDTNRNLKVILVILFFPIAVPNTYCIEIQ